MCRQKSNLPSAPTVSRRGLMRAARGSLLGVGALAFVTTHAVAKPNPRTSDLSPSEGLELLYEGNKLFAAGKVVLVEL